MIENNTIDYTLINMDLQYADPTPHPIPSSPLPPQSTTTSWVINYSELLCTQNYCDFRKLSSATDNFSHARHTLIREYSLALRVASVSPPIHPTSPLTYPPSTYVEPCQLQLHKSQKPITNASFRRCDVFLLLWTCHPFNSSAAAPQCVVVVVDLICAYRALLLLLYSTIIRNVTRSTSHVSLPLCLPLCSVYAPHRSLTRTLTPQSQSRAWVL